MYIPRINRMDDEDEIRDFVRKNNFALLVSSTKQRLWGTHIPLLLEQDADGTDWLVGHAAAANPFCRHLPEGDEVMSVFHGPHAYISSSWYDHENVPTWNYMAVHAYGVLERMPVDQVRAHLKQLVDHHEAPEANPVDIDALNPAMIEREMKGVVGFRIRVTEWQGKAKLSQNRDDANYHRVTDHLDARPDPLSHQVAAEMKQRRSP
jgi:transcriptional regulator